MKKFYIAVAAGIILSLCSHAQTDLTNTGTLQVNTGSAILYISGNFNNNSGSALTNNGQLYVRGNITNNQSSMAVGTGTLFLNGSSAQAVGGTQLFRTFNLNTDNSSGITLNANLHVSGAHTFTTGIITTSATPNYLVYEAGSSYTGSADSRHVNGWVKKLGNTNFTFPVGNGTVLRSIALNSLSASSEFNVRHRINTPSITSAQSPIVNIDPSEYWQVTRVSGGTATVDMNWDNSKIPFPHWILSQVVVAGWNGTQWTDNGGTATGNTTTTGNITSNAVSTFNQFTFGSKAYPVPLTLVSFTAKRNNNYTDITWTTVSEHNVSHFEVERSDDNVHFYSIAHVPARNTGNREKYTNGDNRSINRIAYYRLNCVDIDGRQKYSKIIAVSVDDAPGSIELMTNPVSEEISLMAGNQTNGEYTYTISTAAGQLIQAGEVSIKNAGEYDIRFRKKPQPGIYVMAMRSGNNAYTFKLIVR